MQLHNLVSPEGARKVRKRKGRGTGSGNGKTAGRGMNGQNSRSGGGVRPGFEGGQTPLFRRIPKRGFTNIHRVEYNVINLDTISALNLTEVSPAILKEKGIMKRDLPLKILGNGELTAAVTISAHKFTKTAEEKITAAKGKIEVL